MFSNREIATCLWLLLFSVWGLSIPAVRGSVLQGLKTAAHSKIAGPLFLMLLYTAAIVWGLQSFNLWDATLLKDTVLWFCLTATVLVAKFATARDKTGIFSLVVKENFCAMVVFQFILNAYNFPLLAECFFVPAIGMLVMMEEFAKRDEKNLPAQKIIRFILGSTGLTLIGVAAVNAVSHWQQFGNADTLKAMILPSVLSISLTPFIFLFATVCTYEEIFCRLQMGGAKPADVVRYGRGRILLKFGIRLNRLNTFLHQHAGHLVLARSREDIDRLMVTSGNPEPETAG